MVWAPVTKLVTSSSRHPGEEGSLGRRKESSLAAGRFEESQLRLFLVICKFIKSKKTIVCFISDSLCDSCEFKATLGRTDIST